MKGRVRFSQSGEPGPRRGDQSPVHCLRTARGRCTPPSRGPARDAPLPHALPWSLSRRARVFGRLKHDWALAPLRVRGLDRVKLHADLTILAKLSCTLARARVVLLAAQM